MVCFIRSFKFLDEIGSKTYQTLIAPRKESDFVSTQNSILLSSVLLVLISFGIISLIPHILFSETFFSDPYVITSLVASIFLIIPYFLSRYQHVTKSALIASIFMSIVLFLYALFIDPGDYLTLDYMVLPLIMGVFFQKRKITFQIVFLNFLLLLALPILNPIYSFQDIINYSILFNLLIVSVVYSVHRFILNAERKYQMSLRERDSKIRAMERTDSLVKLSRGIAHDFNNILTVINNSIELMKLEGIESSMEGYFENMENASEEAKALTSQLITFTRMREVGISVLNLNTVITDMSYVLEQLATDSIEINLDISNEDLLLEMNLVELKQIILNLVSNAIEAIPDKGTITIKSIHTTGFQGESYANLIVEDDGIGIPQDLHEIIFDPYFSTKSQGTGIGLATVKEIVSKYNGSIHVESQSDLGTTITISFPVVKDR